MSGIKDLKALEILDSRGNPTIQLNLTLNNGTHATACVPSGASTGQFEAHELRDQDHRYHGKGVQKAIQNIHEIIKPAVLGLDVTQQKTLDNLLCELDGTSNKSKLGANAILAVSLAACRAAANHLSEPLHQYLTSLMTHQVPVLPMPMINVINGGAHADNNLSVQEFMIVPHGFNQFSEALRASAEVFHTLKKELKANAFSTNVGDEGGFAPNLKANEDAINFLLAAIEKAGYKPGEEIALAFDIAATEFYQNNIYKLFPHTFDAQQLADHYIDLINTYPILSIEDPFSETDWLAWESFNKRVGAQVQIVGDDLFVTNVERLSQGIKQKAANAILIKPNQIGTLTETIAAIELARHAKLNAIISHRSAETEDCFIADLAVASGVGQIKTGSLSRTDRVAKYNRLLQIESDFAFDMASF